MVQNVTLFKLPRDIYISRSKQVKEDDGTELSTAFVGNI